MLSVFFVTLALTVWTSAPALAADRHQGKVVEVGACKLTMTDMADKNQHTHEVALVQPSPVEAKRAGSPM